MCRPSPRFDLRAIRFGNLAPNNTDRRLAATAIRPYLVPRMLIARAPTAITVTDLCHPDARPDGPPRSSCQYATANTRTFVAQIAVDDVNSVSPLTPECDCVMLTKRMESTASWMRITKGNNTAAAYCSVRIKNWFADANSTPVGNPRKSRPPRMEPRSAMAESAQVKR